MTTVDGPALVSADASRSSRRSARAPRGERAVVWLAAPVEPDPGVPHESVIVTTDDDLELTASYVPSQNRAAVVLFPGASHSEEARMLIAHGYGVLLLDPRGQGGSEGDTVRWAGDQDVLAGAAYLQERPEVDPGRIGAVGFSVGGESPRQPEYFAAAGEPKSIWKVPGADHIGGLDAQHADYERRVVEFFDAALLGGDHRLEGSRK